MVSTIQTEMMLLLEKARQDPAAKWCLVMIDEEDGKIVNCEGYWEEELDAIAEARRQLNEQARWQGEDELGFSIKVAPYFPRKVT